MNNTNSSGAGNFQINYIKYKLQFNIFVTPESHVGVGFSSLLHQMQGECNAQDSGNANFH